MVRNVAPGTEWPQVHSSLGLILLLSSSCSELNFPLPDSSAGNWVEKIHISLKFKWDGTQNVMNSSGLEW